MMHGQKNIKLVSKCYVHQTNDTNYRLNNALPAADTRVEVTVT